MGGSGYLGAYLGAYLGGPLGAFGGAIVPDADASLLAPKNVLNSLVMAKSALNSTLVKRPT